MLAEMSTSADEKKDLGDLAATMGMPASPQPPLAMSEITVEDKKEVKEAPAKSDEALKKATEEKKKAEAEQVAADEQKRMEAEEEAAKKIEEEAAAVKEKEKAKK